MKFAVQLLAAAGLASLGAAWMDDDMGPAMFLWPTSRDWSESADNTAPCGSTEGVGNRTDFPLTGGKVGLVDQDEAYDVQLSISYSNDPTSDADFSVLVASSRLSDLELGHTCLSVSDPPSSVVAGSNGTFQIKYTAVFDSTTNQTFYSCADITYVATADFSTSEENALCFNYTESSTTSTASSSTASSTSATSSSSSSSSSGSSLSKGAIAGVVVGCVVGAAMILGALLWTYRRSQQTKRRSRLEEMELRGRNVQWKEEALRGSGSAA